MSSSMSMSSRGLGVNLPYLNFMVTSLSRPWGLRSGVLGAFALGSFGTSLSCPWTLLRQFRGPNCVSSPDPGASVPQDPAASVVVLLPSPRHLRHVVHGRLVAARGPFWRRSFRRLIAVLVGSADAPGGGKAFEHELDRRRAQWRRCALVHAEGSGRVDQ